MCLGVPGQVVHWVSHDPLFAAAEVEFAGVRRTCQMACVPDAKVGDYVIVHAGIAISRVDRDEAEKSLAELQQLGLLDELSNDA
ncbi:MAG: HypC/HybG/HupF family hydrogenase formation chaperone [Planctomycetaceae bacterium]|nr:HypC/HybG/HupF family hydrogenase formation chaperone [Planctomycetaceae bacterium]